MNGLIVGGGIGGVTAAIALARAGHRVVLVEKLERFSPVGAGIVLAPNATKILAALGVDLSSRGYALPFLNILRADGTVLQQLNAQRLSVKYGPTWALTRPALHDALLGALPSEVEVILGRTVLAVKEVGDAVEVQLEAEPNVRRFDFVVGADGLHSKVRERLLGPQPLRYSGVTCWRGVAKNPGFTGAIEAWGRGARIGAVPLREERVYYYLVKTAHRRAPPLTFPEGFQDTFGNFRGGVEKLFEVLQEAPSLHHDLEELESPVWGRSQVFLLGDAAHAMTPNQGQGAAMAIEDALALAVALRAGVRGALERYVECRHMRVRRMQLDSRRIGSISHWRNPLACSVRDNLLRLLPASLGEAQYHRIVEPGLALLQASQRPE